MYPVLYYNYQWPSSAHAYIQSLNPPHPTNCPLAPWLPYRAESMKGRVVHTEILLTQFQGLLQDQVVWMGLRSVLYQVLKSQENGA